MLLRIIFWIFGILFSIISVLGIYFLAFYFGFFGVLEKAEPNVNATYPKDLLTKKIQSQLEHSLSNKQILFEVIPISPTMYCILFIYIFF